MPTATTDRQTGTAAQAGTGEATHDRATLLGAWHAHGNADLAAHLAHHGTAPLPRPGDGSWPGRFAATDRALGADGSGWGVVPFCDKARAGPVGEGKPVPRRQRHGGRARQLQGQGAPVVRAAPRARRRRAGRLCARRLADRGVRRSRRARHRVGRRARRGRTRRHGTGAGPGRGAAAPGTLRRRRGIGVGLLVERRTGGSGLATGQATPPDDRARCRPRAQRRDARTHGPRRPVRPGVVSCRRQRRRAGDVVGDHLRRGRAARCLRGRPGDGPRCHCRPGAARGRGGGGAHRRFRRDLGSDRRAGHTVCTSFDVRGGRCRRCRGPGGAHATRLWGRRDGARGAVHGRRECRTMRPVCLRPAGRCRRSRAVGPRARRPRRRRRDSRCGSPRWTDGGRAVTPTAWPAWCEVPCRCSRPTSPRTPVGTRARFETGPRHSSGRGPGERGEGHATSAQGEPDRLRGLRVLRRAPTRARHPRRMGVPVVSGDPVPAHLVELARRAARDCPRRAFHVERADDR